MILIVHATEREDTIERSLGLPDYSYYFVLKEFLPVLETLGTVVPVREPTNEVGPLHRACSQRGEPCLFLSFAPPHRMPLDLACPTLPVFAWEFRDIPTETWNLDPRHDWRVPLGRAAGAITHSTFAARAVEKVMGANFPTLAVPAPVWDRFQSKEASSSPAPCKSTFELTFRGRLLESGRREPLNDEPGEAYDGAAGFELDLDGTDRMELLPADQAPWERVRLDGVIYTSVFSPTDGRKNWQDALRGFCVALRDRADATLVLKVCGPGSSTFRRDISSELDALSPFRCRVVVIDAFLDEGTYRLLALRSTYAVNTSLGEGQCLPLMEYMSHGVPAVAPDHTGMSEYVDPSNAFVIRSSLEPASWPQDPRHKIRTFRHRIHAESVVEAFERSYRVAKEKPALYDTMAKHARERLRRHASCDVVREKLRIFLSQRLLAPASS